MSPQSRLVAGIVLIIVPTVEIGGASILSLLITDPAYAQNDLRQDLWRAGHAHAGVWLVLSLVALRYVDEALSEGMRWVVRLAFPAAAVLMALGFFLSVLSPEATEPNAMIYLAYVAGLLLAVGLLGLGVGLIRGVGRRASPLDHQQCGLIGLEYQRLGFGPSPGCYSPECVEVRFSEVGLPLYGVLISSRGGLLLRRLRRRQRLIQPVVGYAVEEDLRSAFAVAVGALLRGEQHVVLGTPQRLVACLLWGG